jgi:hypothetical protein
VVCAGHRCPARVVGRQQRVDGRFVGTTDALRGPNRVRIIPNNSKVDHLFSLRRRSPGQDLRSG